MSVEDRVRGSLSRQASDVDPSTDGWDRIVQRLREGEPTPAPTSSRVRRLAIIAAALAIFALAMIPLLISRHAASPAPAPQHSAATGVSPVPSPSTPLSAVNRCRSGQLSAREIVTGGAAGNVWAPIVVVNRSAIPCRLAGYPDLRFLDKSGNDLGLGAVHSPDYAGGTIPPSPVPPTPFVLAPASRAWFIVHFGDVQPPCTRVFGLSISLRGAGGVVEMHVNPIHEWAVCSGMPTVTVMTLDRPRF